MDGKTIYAAGTGEFRTQGLPILKLGTTLILRGAGSVTATEFSVTLSGLSYIRAILKSGTATTEAKDAMSALYQYYRSACAYNNLLTGGGSDPGLTGESIVE